jgi:hypothetical protein
MNATTAATEVPALSLKSATRTGHPANGMALVRIVLMKN